MDKMFFAYLAAMAIVTYAIRMVPFAVMRKKIKSPYIKSFLYYVPYSVLGAMTFPYIFYTTGNFYAAVAGTAVSFVLAFFDRSLLTVAVCACIAAFAVKIVF